MITDRPDGDAEAAVMGAEGAAPVVFQCAQCRTIVGDSATISSMDPEARTMSIKRTPRAARPLLHAVW